MVGRRSRKGTPARDEGEIAYVRGSKLLSRHFWSTLAIRQAVRYDVKIVIRITPR